MLAYLQNWPSFFVCFHLPSSEERQPLISRGIWNNTLFKRRNIVSSMKSSSTQDIERSKINRIGLLKAIQNSHHSNISRFPLSFIFLHQCHLHKISSPNSNQKTTETMACMTTILLLICLRIIFFILVVFKNKNSRGNKVAINRLFFPTSVGGSSALQQLSTNRKLQEMDICIIPSV